jgi:anti-sigma factor RsiW
MKHPSQTTLALHAGGDLGRFARWRLDRHLADCDQCREEVAAFGDVREMLPELDEMPEVAWNRLAAEMKANIRLGVAAGECVRPGEVPLRKSLFTGVRAAVALASVVALLVTGLMIERPVPRQILRNEGVVVQRIPNGIQVREGGQALQLMHAGAQHVTYSVGAQGSLRARFVDQETGNVTFNTVYVEE